MLDSCACRKTSSICTSLQFLARIYSSRVQRSNNQQCMLAECRKFIPCVKQSCLFLERRSSLVSVARNRRERPAHSIGVHKNSGWLPMVSALIPVERGLPTLLVSRADTLTNAMNTSTDLSGFHSLSSDSSSLAPPCGCMATTIKTRHGYLEAWVQDVSRENIRRSPVGGVGALRMKPRLHLENETWTPRYPFILSCPLVCKGWDWGRPWAWTLLLAETALRLIRICRTSFVKLDGSCLDVGCVQTRISTILWL
ncbi:hypothetical protein C8Q74DRAFT_731302 [Fomes fomentarius]|nr:hypothetical protein C8Q74DRAFT_731302 [Fomes fomentarius]